MSRPVFVCVLLEMGASGARHPLRITWEDGVYYEITHSNFVGRRAARSAGSGECWICRIADKDVPLYYSPLTGRWWMDGKGDGEPAPTPEPYRRVKDRNYTPPEK
ncbi:MAG: hypothetical protein GX850_00620 [Clostridiaceae bacterium]|jgi:hypothetical protein|nr:hypothetical protein [Clostridiaceae bacterium]